MTGSDERTTTRETARGPSPAERVEKLTRRPRKGSGKILTMRQLRKMSSVLAKRFYRDASGSGGTLNARDRKQSAVAYGVLVDKLVTLAPHDKHIQVEHDGDPAQLAAIQDLALRIAEVGRVSAENVHSQPKTP